MLLLIIGSVYAAAPACNWQKDAITLQCDNVQGTVGHLWTSLGVQCGCAWDDVCSITHPSGALHGKTTLFEAREAVGLEDVCTENTPCKPGPSICSSGDLDSAFDAIILVWILVPLCFVSSLVGLIICAYVGACCWASKNLEPDVAF